MHKAYKTSNKGVRKERLTRWHSSSTKYVYCGCTIRGRCTPARRVNIVSFSRYVKPWWVSNIFLVTVSGRHRHPAQVKDLVRVSAETEWKRAPWWQITRRSFTMSVRIWKYSPLCTMNMEKQHTHSYIRMQAAGLTFCLICLPNIF